MYVCLCNAVKDSDIVAAVAAGHRDLEAVSEQLGVATGCGSCQAHAQSIIEASLADESEELFHAA